MVTLYLQRPKFKIVEEKAGNLKHGASTCIKIDSFHLSGC